MKIVPTIYEDLNGIRRYPYQFTFVYRVRIVKEMLIDIPFFRRKKIWNLRKDIFRHNNS